MTTTTIPTPSNPGPDPRRAGGGSLAVRALATVVALACATSAVRYIVDQQAFVDPTCRQANRLYAARTLAAIAMQCLGDLDGERTRDNALMAIRRQPRNQVALAAMGSDADLAERRGMADRWMTYARRLGHRDFAVQTYWIGRAHQHGDAGAEAGSLDALLRSGWKSDEATAALRRLETTARGRRALLSVLRANPPWAGSYLGDVSDLDARALDNRMAVMMQLAREAGGSGDPDRWYPAARTTVHRLFAMGQVTKARAVRFAFPPAATPGAVNDSGLAALDPDHASPFDWNLANASGIELDPRKAGGLDIRCQDPGRYYLAWQAVSLAPGVYRLLAHTTGTASPDSRLVAALTPVGGRGKTRTVALPVGEGEKDAILVIDPEDPADFRLQIMLDVPNTAQTVDLTLRSLVIRPAA